MPRHSDRTNNSPCPLHTSAIQAVRECERVLETPGLESASNARERDCGANRTLRHGKKSRICTHGTRLCAACCASTSLVKGAMARPALRSLAACPERALDAGFEALLL